MPEEENSRSELDITIIIPITPYLRYLSQN